MKKLAILIALFVAFQSIYAISLITNYTTWQSMGSTELNFNTIANGTYLSNQFASQGVSFGSYNGPVYVSDVRTGSDIAGYKEIDFGGGEWLDVTFVVPNTTTPAFTTGFGVKLNTPDNYNWVAFYDRLGNHLATYYAASSAISAAGNYFLGAYHADGIGRVRIGSDNLAFETYNYELLAVAVPEPSAIGLIILAIFGMLTYRRKVL